MKIRFYRATSSFLSLYAPENIFLVLASCLSVLYMATVSPLTNYVHGTERFLHIVNYAMAWTGEPGRMPVGFLEMVKQTGPGILLREYGTQTKVWDDELGITPYFSHKKLAEGLRNGERETIRQWASRMESLPDPYNATVSFITNKNPAMYSVIGYVPFIIPAAIGLVAQEQPIVILYACILFNAVFCILLGYYAIRITPALKWFYVFLLILPSVCMNRALVMPDAVTLGLCLLMIAMVMRLKADGQLLTLKRKFGFVICAALIGVVKNAYFLVPAVGWLIPSTCFRSNVAKILWIGAGVAASVITAVAWNIHALSATHIAIPSLNPRNIAFSGILSQVLTLPLSAHQWLYWLNNMFFWNISLLDRNHLYGASTLTLIVMGASCFLALTLFPCRDSTTFTLLPRERGICGMIFFMTMFIIIMAVSLQSHTVTAQGRYFLPILPLLSTMLYRAAIVPGKAHFIALCIIGISSCCWAVMHYYMLSHF